jgi:hypothetical protein
MRNETATKQGWRGTNETIPTIQTVGVSFIIGCCRAIRWDSRQGCGRIGIKSSDDTAEIGALRAAR